MGLVDDPISGVIGVFFKHAMNSKLLSYFRLTYSLSLAATISFLVVTGGTLVTAVPVPVSIGSGMLAAGVAMFATFQVSDDAKGIRISVVQDVSQAKFDTPTTTVERK